MIRKVLYQVGSSEKISVQYMTFCLNQNNKIFLVCLCQIDFQQAFDSISWKVIDRTLDYFNFGPSFKNWKQLFQKGSESCILQNGYMPDYFTLQRD